jgi:hypothetical protein
MITSSPKGQTNSARNTIMKPVFAAVLALACVVGSTDGFARGVGLGGAHGFAHGGGMGRGSVRDFGNPAPQMPAFENRIPAPLAAPQQAPVINGPMSQPSLRGM